MHWRKYLGFVAFVALLLTSCSLSSSTSTSTPTPAATSGVADDGAHFDRGQCPFSVGGGLFAGGNVTCGNLVTHENRTDSTSGTIHVAAAIFKTSDPHPAPDPLILLQGGPGGRLIQDLAPALVSGRVAMERDFGNHDVILVDQRGTGYSTPSLQCPEVVALQFNTDQNLSAAQQVTNQTNALKVCHTRLTNEGVNPSAYTSLSDAGDIHDLIQALGLHQVDLYGVSYGTRLALEVMRAFPQGIRSVVLDSTVPAQKRLLTSIPDDTARVFGVLFAGCAADSTCNAKYPQLDTTFYSLVTTLNAHPITFVAQDPATNKSYTVLFHGDDLVNLLFSGLYPSSFIPYLPALIYEVKQGKYTDLLPQFYAALTFDDSVAWGMYFSVECAEDISLVTPQQVATAAQAFPPQIRPAQLTSLEGEFGQCQVWNVHTAAASEGQAVTSAIPTLVLEGEYDPITPPANGMLAAQTLSTSYQFLFPGTGHGSFLYNFASPTATYFATCPTGILLAFERNPTQKPDGSCISGVGEPQWQ